MSCSSACSCGCCVGLHAVTPLAIQNRPGMSRVSTRIGTHGRFLSTMLARLSAADYPALAQLRTRDRSDSSIALLDAWATVADVLTFYQERIANEGYLRTATERRSLIELGRLINYVPRPGVAASVYLAFEMEKEPQKAIIPKGTKANSIPGPGETMEAFETSEEITARPEWNAIRPRLVQPQSEELISENGLYLKGTATKLKAGDLLLIEYPGKELTPNRIARISVDHSKDRTFVEIVGSSSSKNKKDTGDEVNSSESRLASLLLQPTVAPPSAARLLRSVEASFAVGADTLPKLKTAFRPTLADTLFASLRNAAPTGNQAINVFAMRIEARAFGHNAPLQLKSVGSNKAVPTFAEWTTSKPWGDANSDNDALLSAHTTQQLFLDNNYELAADTLVVIESASRLLKIVNGEDLTITPVSLNAYGLSGKSIKIQGAKPLAGWLEKNEEPFSKVRSSRIFLGSERLELADAPIAELIGGDTLELDGLYEGLEPGRWLIIEGERADIQDESGATIPGIRGAELVMLNAVTLTNKKPKFVLGDTYHSTLTLAAITAAGTSGLAYSYKRDTVTIYANVAHATHGETRQETLGSGSATEPHQQFRLKMPPLTHISAQSPSGISSTLEIRVNDLRWHEAATLAEIGTKDRSFIVRTGDDDKVDIVFGNGRHGLRLPTGRENVRALYRSGIGQPGNVKARQISLLGSRPLGAKNVINPMRASGGANRDEAEAIRRNASLAILALDRLISTTDYADFARSFGGIGKASAASNKGLVEVVIAGVEDAAVDESSDLFRALKAALHRYGDPQVRVKLKVRERASLVIQAGVRIEPDYFWETVEPKIRATLLDTFSFANRALGASVFLSEVLGAIHKVKGVAAADIDVFGILSEAQLLSGSSVDLTLWQANHASPNYGRIKLEPNQIAYLLAEVPETLILQEVTV
jgi:hypothetical protein